MWWKLCIVCRGEPRSPASNCTNYMLKHILEISQTCRGGYYPPALMKYYVRRNVFWYDENCVFNFARIACNRVRCTRTGEHGSPLHYFGNCISFIRFIFIINFLLLLAGGWYPPLRDCANNYNTTLGHNMFFDITNYLHEWGTAARRAGGQWPPLQKEIK